MPAKLAMSAAATAAAPVAVAGQAAQPPATAAQEAEAGEAAQPPATAAQTAGAGQAAQPKRPPEEALQLEPIPAKKLRLPDAAAEPPRYKRPVLPSETSTSDAWGVMQRYIPWAKGALKEFLANRPGSSQADLCEYKPLKIDAEESGKNKTSSYQAPWEQKSCQTSLKQSGLYQAGANITWFSPSSIGTCPQPAITWAQLQELVQTFFQPQAAAEEGNLQGAGRIVFPTILEGYIRDMGELGAIAGQGPGEIPLLAGQGLVQAWWLAIGEALQAGEAARVASLWQCGRSVTALVRCVAGLPELMALSSAAGESMRVTAKTLTGTFFTFAQAAAFTGLPLDRANLSKFKELGLRYNGAFMNYSMLNAAQQANKIIGDEARLIIADIEGNFGRDIFSVSYSKLLRIFFYIDKAATELRSTVQDMADFYFAAARRTLAESGGKAGTFATSEIETTAAAPGHVTRILARAWVRDAAMDEIEDLARLDKPPPVVADLRKVAAWFRDMQTFEKEFPVAEATCAGEAAQRAGEAAQRAGEAAQAGAGDTAFGGGFFCSEEDATDPVEARKKDLSKHCAMLLDLLYCAMAGDADIALKAALAADTSAGLNALEKLKVDGGGILGAHLREFISAVHSHRRVIAAAEAGASAPPPGQRALKRFDSQTDDVPDESARQLQLERQELWKSAQALRRKTSFVGQWMPPLSGEAGAAKAYNKCSALRDFKGKQKELHRAFVWSADLAGESAAEPWKDLSEFAEEAFEASWDFMSKQNGPFDLLVFADGRNRKARRAIEDKVEERGHVCESWVVYAGSGAFPGCRNRTVAYAAPTREVVFTALPCPRTNIPTKNRAVYNACGETSTHFGTYTRVPPLPGSAMARVSPEDKKGILGLPGVPASPPPQLADMNGSVPLFWQERKNVAFWRAFLCDNNVGAVVDMSGGSGVLAQACLLEGWPYLAITRTAMHAQFLQNRLDRDALSTISLSGSAMYSADMAASIKEHFADIVNEEIGEDGDEEEEVDEDDEE